MEEKFFKLFAGLDRAHGQFRIAINPEKADGKIKGRAQTILSPPSPELWKKHLDGKLGIGIIPITDEGTCCWGAIDIDVYNIDLKQLEKTIRENGIPSVVCRTKSGGAHLYFFFSEYISAEIVKTKLEELAAILGFPDVEIFPKQVKLANKNDVGNWINMPYFDHERTLRYALYQGQGLKAERFLELAGKIKISKDEFVAIKVRLAGELADGPPCLQHFCKVGFPKGSMNNALFSMGVYARKKYGDDWEDWVDKYNHKYMGPGSSQEVQNIIRSLKKKNYIYKCEDQPLVTICNKPLCIRRKYGIGGGEDAMPYVLGTLVKVDSSPPMWFVDVDGHRIELTTEDLIDQRKFRKICIEKIHKFPPMVKGYIWDQLIAERLQDLEVLDAPKDASVDGQFMVLLEKFTSRPAAETKEQLLLGRHFVDEKNDIYFRSNDLMSFLDRERFREFRSPRDIWGALRRIGAKHGQFYIKGKNVQWWRIPMLNLQTEDFDINKDDMTEY